LSFTSFLFWVVGNLFLACSDDDELDIFAAPSRQAVIPDKPSAPETELSMEASWVTRSSIKKVPVSQSAKKSKKSKEANVSLEAHEPSSSSDNVSGHILEDFSFLFACAYVLLFC
jgi:hypothetical protein